MFSQYNIREWHALTHTCTCMCTPTVRHTFDECGAFQFASVPNIQMIFDSYW
jgi:hypothetical protein